MEKALSAIAQELQSFSLYTPQENINTRDIKSYEILNDMVMVKSKLSTRNKQMKRLRKNMKTADVVARAVISAKNDETAYLSKHIQQSRDQCKCLLRQNRLSDKVIEDLKSEGQNLKGEKEAIELYIHLGYEQLQKMRNLPLKKLSVMEMLKEIIITCGEYYSDYENECLKTQHLEHKNRFLTAEISILNKNNKAMDEELVTMRIQNMRLQAENQILKNKQNSGKPTMAVQELEHRSSFYTFDNKMKNTSFSDDSKCKSKPANTLNFSSHFSTIKTLLEDQDDMLKSLKKISEELTIHEYSCL